MMIKESVDIVIKIFEKDYEEDNNISLPESIYMQLNEKSDLILKVGRAEKKVQCSINDTRDTLEITHKLLDYLGLFKDRVVNLIIKGNRICLGPVIGLFVSNGQVRKANIQSPSFRWIETFNANKDAKAIIYYFSIKDVDFAQKKIIGTYFNEEDQVWEKREFPYPDVLYDRGGGTLKSQMLISDYIRKELQLDESLIKVNSRYFFDKWDVHEKLSNYKEISSHLPYTILYTKPEDLVEMLKLSSSVYIKDCLGNNGVGVARLRKLSEEEYELSHFFKKTFKFILSSIDEVEEKLKEIFENKKMIIQSAIDLLQIDGRNIDMRATVQKDGNGNLGVAAFPVRIGKAECPITSTRSGSTVYTMDRFLNKFYNYSELEIENLKRRISEFLISSFKCIEEVYGSFGEIGIDFALDKEWNIWFIECNAKPGKDTVYLSYDDNIVKRVFLNPLDYAKYLWKNS